MQLDIVFYINIIKHYYFIGYVITIWSIYIIRLLRDNNENDYHKVFQILEKENLGSKKESGETKGFSTSKTTSK